MSERITERKLKNQKFRRTEASILLAVISIGGISSVGRLIKTAGISRSTLYRHHKNVYAIIPDCEYYLLKKYQRSIRRLTKTEKFKLRQLYERTLIFMFRNQKAIRLLIQCGDSDIIEKMLAIIEPDILATKKIAAGEMSKIHTKTTSAIVEQWGIDGFDKNQISAVVDKIVFLTNAAHATLDPIVKHDL